MTLGEVRELKRKRRRMAAILPLLSQQRQAELRRKIQRIDARLGTRPSFSTKRRGPGTKYLASAAGVDGIGGLSFRAASPPGEQRLVRLPFYLYAVEPPAVDQGNLGALAPSQALYVTGAGIETVDETNPVVIAQVPSTLADGTVVTTTAWASKLVGMRFRTPLVEWADLQVVGLAVSQRRCPYVALDDPLAAAAPSPVPGVGAPNYIAFSGQPTNALYYTPLPAHLFLTGLTVGGGASLLMQSGFCDANIYDDRIPEFAGLRAYPKLTSPNRAYIEAALQGGPATSSTFSLALVCEILSDTEYGSGVPGPYLRRDAVRRLAPPDGQTFVEAS